MQIFIYCKVTLRVSGVTAPIIRSTKNCNRSLPMYGITDRSFVMTVAPHNDICPHGNTYPLNAVAMVKNRITTPTDHLCMKLCDPYYKFRPVCKYRVAQK